jgi:hypothetical protein
MLLARMAKLGPIHRIVAHGYKEQRQEKTGTGYFFSKKKCCLSLLFPQPATNFPMGQNRIHTKVAGNVKRIKLVAKLIVNCPAFSHFY